MDTLQLEDLTVEAPPFSEADWNEDGVVIIPGAVDLDAIRAYEATWKESNGYRDVDPAGLLLADRPGGWPDCTPYMRHPEILDLFAPLADKLEELIGEPAGMNLNLTGWVTTERDWHQDSYLNEPEVGDYYAAVWLALGDVDARSGPFQYVPGSHRWPQVTRELIGRHLDLEDPAWPKMSELLLTPLFEAELERRQAEIVTHVPDWGEALIWHGRLLHRGSKAQRPGMYRPGVIAHFSGIHHRPQMPTARQWRNGGWYFPIHSSGPV